MVCAIDLPRLGVSLIDEEPVEVVYVSLSGVRLRSSHVLIDDDVAEGQAKPAGTQARAAAPHT